MRSPSNWSKLSSSAVRQSRLQRSSQGRREGLCPFTKDPGVNTNETFVTYVFVVTNNAVAGNATLSLDFDTIITTDYDKPSVENKNLTYNKPTISVEIISDNVAATSSESATTSNKPVESGSTSSNNVTSESNNKKPSDKAPDKITTVDDSYLNPEFSASDVAAGEQVEKEPTQSELIEQTQSKLSQEFSNAGIDPNDVYNKNKDGGINLPLLIGFIVLGVVALAAIITLVIILANKKKN
ncbi:MAG: hypothetical protein IIW83_04385 [Clostridia bacterium]|nr:hypothetical protein [Clostridia bacterium]